MRLARLKGVLDFLLICAGFGVSGLLYTMFLRGGLSRGELFWGSLFSAVTFWVVIQFQEARGGGQGTSPIDALEQFCLGTGANLLLHSLLTYAFLSRRTPFLIVMGGILAAVFRAAEGNWFAVREQKESRLILVGVDEITWRVARSLGVPVTGVIDSDPGRAPKGVPVLGDVSRFSEIMREYSPTHLLIGREDQAHLLSAAALLECRLSGVIVEDSPSVYERMFHRVNCERLRPMDLLLSSALRGDSRTMAIQAVYTNIAGLFFLIVLSPLLALTAAAVLLFGGPGRVIESVECAGFQYIPFRLLRFRTRRSGGDRQQTAVGRMIARLRLHYLPQLVNVVRGEMALVGPRPVRREFAHKLTELMPFYSHRFSVRPGLVGWAQMHVANSAPAANECLQIGYDLYYVKEGSPWFDGEILATTMMGETRTRRAAAAREQSEPVFPAA